MGYAGLHQLQQMKALPVDILKIDKVFIDMLPEDVSMVPAMIQLARGRGADCAGWILAWVMPGCTSYSR
ncbi:hypothetical protein CP989_25270 [Enterobacter hormaechei]|nr:hypothetical protein CP989_25270 [Enterobacter hormaechei]